MDIISIIIFLVGFFAITGVIWITCYFIYHNFLTIYASAMSREMQGLETLPRPPLKNLVKLIQFMKSKQGEIEAELEKMDENKHDNAYQ